MVPGERGLRCTEYGEVWIPEPYLTIQMIILDMGHCGRVGRQRVDATLKVSILIYEGQNEIQCFCVSK